MKLKDIVTVIGYHRIYRSYFSGRKPIIFLLVIFAMSILSFECFGQQHWQSPEVVKRELKTKFRIAQRFEAQGQIDQALEIYKYLVDKDPLNYSYYQRYTYHLFSLKNYAELQRVIQQHLQYNPNAEGAIVDLGKLYFSRGDTTLADEYWQSELRRLKYSRSFFRTLYNGLISLREFERADKLIKQARDYYGKADLFALEVANIQMMRGNYLESAREYLIWGRNNTGNYRQISSRILRFPTDSSLYAELDSLIQQELNRENAPRETHKLRADIMFKFHHYTAAVNEIMLFESLNQYKGDEILDLAMNLAKEGEYRLAEETYTRIIANNQFRNILPNALLGLADAFEKEMFAERELSPFDYFYKGNFFFTSDYITGIDVEEHQIKKAFAIYDSVITNLPRTLFTAQALYRLAELRYRVLQDFDGAGKLYQAAIQNGSDWEICSRCILRLVDLMIAKGESAGAIQYIKETLPAYSGSPVEKALTVRLMLAEFYSGEIDSVVSRKNDLLGLLGINDPLFNDVIEFTGFIEKYQSGGGVSSPEALNDFIKSEQYLRQNKLSEAKEVLNYILINYPSENISIPVRFRLIQIDLFFRQFEQAEQNLDQLLIAENVYADGALFMMGEIAQFRDANPEYAAKWYEIILQRYPNSLYTDTVRKRLRNLQNAQLLRNNL